MRVTRFVSLALAVSCLLLTLPRASRGQAAKGDDIFIPGEMKFRLELLSPLTTATNQKGDDFSCKVLEPPDYAGALVSGSVKSAKRSGKVKGDSKMELEFKRMQLSDGRSGSFKAQITEVYDVVDAADGGKADTEGVVKARSTVKRDMLKISAGAAVGAVIGGIFGGAKGAAAGAAIGGGLAASSTLASKGPDLEFKQGTQFNVLTSGPRQREGKRSGEAASPSDSAASVAPLLEGAKGARVEAPPASYKTYRNNFYSVSVPDNRREFASGGPVTLAPEGSCGVHEESVTVSATALRKGRLFYLIASTPQSERDAYRQTFADAIRPVQFGDSEGRDSPRDATGGG